MFGNLQTHMPNIKPNSFSENVSNKSRPKRILAEQFIRNGPMPSVDEGRSINMIRKFASQPRGAIKRDLDRGQNLLLPIVDTST